MKHQSVLLKESVAALNLKKDSIVIDATLGLGGHSLAILKQIPLGFLIAFDQDETAIKIAQKNLAKYQNFEIVHVNFIELIEQLEKRNINEVNAILFDLGVSSPQLDEKHRGFSFHQDAPLDMRMDLRNNLTAKFIVNNYSFLELKDLFWKYGDEKYAKNIARAIEAYRQNKEIVTTFELVEIIKKSVPAKYRSEKHPARKVFQALRIEVNNELEVLDKAIRQALNILAINGRLAVITFHSLEDKICQNIFKEVSLLKPEFKKLPFVPEEHQPDFKIIGKVLPTKNEIENNNRARSAKLRIIERVKR